MTKETKEILRIVRENYIWLVVLGLILILFLGIYIRSVDISSLKDITTGNYTLGQDLDPFLYLRNAQAIINNNLTNPDMMWAAPLGNQPYAYHSLMPWVMAGFYKLLNIFGTISLELSACILPIFLTALAIIFFFMFVQKSFSYIIKKPYDSIGALIAALLYAVVPQMLHRTTGGIPEIESLGMPFMWLAFYFFILAWENKKQIQSIVLAGLSGIFTGLMVWSWGGSEYIFLALSLTVFISFFFSKLENKNLTVYAIWWFFSNLAIYLRSNMSLTSTFNRLPDFILSTIVLVIILVHFIMEKFVYSKPNYNFKLDKKLTSVICALLFLVLIALILFGPSFVVDKASSLVNYITTPFEESRVGLTVAENKVPYLTEIDGAFDVHLFNITISLFWFFFFGSMVLFYYAVKHFNIKDRLILNAAFIIFLVGLMFSRISSSNLMNGDNFVSKFAYFGSIVLLFAVIIRIYFKEQKNKEDSFSKINFIYLLLISLTFFSAISMRGAVRLLFIISPFVVISTSYLLAKLMEKTAERKNGKNFLPYILLSIILIALVLFVAKGYAQQSYYETKYTTAPGPYQIEWQNAMAWVRNNTAQNAIFVHWWDYGYWIQTIGKRATVTDGGHLINYWDHTTARYLMTAEKEQTALQLAKAHNVSYILFDSTDISKYGAFASIGSDKDCSSGGDRCGYINTFIVDENQTQELKNEVVFVYVSYGGLPIDEDIVWNGQLLPQNKAGIIGFLVHQSGNQIKGVEAVIYYKNQRYDVPVNYVYFNNKKVKVSNSGIDAVFYFIPTLSSKSINPIGSGLYLSPRVARSEFARVYLLGETNLKLVHEENFEVVKQINSAYGTNFSFVLANQLYGPIRIYSVGDLTNVPYYSQYTERKSLENSDFAKLDYLGK